MESTFECPCSFCGSVFFSKMAAAGHLARGCKVFKDVKASGGFEMKFLNHQEEFVENTPLEQWRNSVSIEFDEVLSTEFPIEFAKYLDHQKQFLDLKTLEDLNAGYVRLTDGSRGKSIIEVYLEVCDFVHSCNYLSRNKEADGLINMVKKITAISGFETRLPSKYQYMEGHVMNALNPSKIPVQQTLFELPEEIWGPEPHASGNFSESFTNISVILLRCKNTYVQVSFLKQKGYSRIPCSPGQNCYATVVCVVNGMRMSD